MQTIDKQKKAQRLGSKFGRRGGRIKPYPTSLGRDA